MTPAASARGAATALFSISAAAAAFRSPPPPLSHPANFIVRRTSTVVADRRCRRAARPVVVWTTPLVSFASSSDAFLAMMADSSSTSAANGKKANVPNRPLPYLSASSSSGSSSSRSGGVDLTDVDVLVSRAEERRQSAFDLSRKINVAIVKVRTVMETEFPTMALGDEREKSAMDGLEGLVREALLAGGSPSSSTAKKPDEENAKASSSSHRIPREANLSYRIEEYARLLAYRNFLSTGTLLPPSSLPPEITDEEYVGGACIGLSSDLARYAVGRATVRDVRSVRMARDLVGGIMGELLQFDFRNGPLRRKYDGTKYALRSLETVLYELSVTGGGGTEDAAGAGGTIDEKAEADGMEVDEPERKRSRSDEASGAATRSKEGENGDGSGGIIPTKEIEDLRRRMDHRDRLREDLIKKCRDGQKAAKQSIFALHRADYDRAKKLLIQCESCIRNDLTPIVTEEPGLRYGSFSNVMEEYAEAGLFHAWLLGPPTDGTWADPLTPRRKGPVESPAGSVLKMENFPVRLEPEDYLGGLCDLTGEVGRHAVQRGTDRDVSAVKLCLGTNMGILNALRTMERLPSGIGKKMDPLRRSVEKLERMLYEMSLVEATGGTRKVEADSVHEGTGGMDGERE